MKYAFIDRFRVAASTSADPPAAAAGAFLGDSMFERRLFVDASMNGVSLKEESSGNFI